LKYRVKLHRLAERDLNDIYDFIAADNPIAALRYARRIKAHCESLSRMPKRGAPREDLALAFERFPSKAG
jgi:plasmid stabilization system protein ParE